MEVLSDNTKATRNAIELMTVELKILDKLIYKLTNQLRQLKSFQHLRECRKYCLSIVETILDRKPGELDIDGAIRYCEENLFPKLVTELMCHLRAGFLVQYSSLALATTARLFDLLLKLKTGYQQYLLDESSKAKSFTLPEQIPSIEEIKVDQPGQIVEENKKQEEKEILVKTMTMEIEQPVNKDESIPSGLKEVVPSPEEKAMCISPEINEAPNPLEERGIEEEGPISVTVPNPPIDVESKIAESQMAIETRIIPSSFDSPERKHRHGAWPGVPKIIITPPPPEKEAPKEDIIETPQIEITCTAKIVLEPNHLSSVIEQQTVTAPQPGTSIQRRALKRIKATNVKKSQNRRGFVSGLQGLSKYQRLIRLKTLTNVQKRRRTNTSI